MSDPIGWGDQEWGSSPWGGVPGTLNPETGYRLVLADRSGSGLGTPIVSDVFAAGLPYDSEYACRWSRGIGTAGTIEFTLPIDGCDAADFAPGQRELHLYRDDGRFGEQLAWAGHLWVADVRAPWVRFLGMGWYEALRHREMSEDFYKFNAEQRNIAWQLIDYTQSQTDGGLGITRESAAGSSTQRTVAYCAEERQNIAEAIEDLAAADDGFDFEVGPDKVWRTWTPSRGSDLSGSITLDTTTSIVDMSYTADATSIENDVAGVGSKGDCEPIHFVTVLDTASRSAYGLMQATIERSDMKWDDEHITALAREELALRKDIRRQPRIKCFQGLIGNSPLTGDFDLGDVIGVEASWGYATFSDTFRLLDYAVTFDRMGNEMLEFTFDAVA